MTNHFKGPYITYKNETECWEACVKEVDCVAITFCEECNRTCYLFNKTGYESEPDANYVSMGYDSVEIFIKNKPTINPSKRLLNPIMRLLGSCRNEFECWIKCLKMDGCAAVSFCSAPTCNRTCNLYKQGEYGVTKDDNYVSLALQSESLDKKSVVSIYEGFRIRESKRSIKVNNEEQCWMECLKERETRCEAISFSTLNSTCYFHENPSSSILLLASDNYKMIGNGEVLDPLSGKV